MHAFAHILACALPFLILKFPTIAASSGASESGSVTQGNAIVPRALDISTAYYDADASPIEAREIRNPDYSSSTPQDATSRNTTTTPARDITEEDNSDHESKINNDEHDRGAHFTVGTRNVLFSRAAGKFQVKQLRQRSAELDARAVTKLASGPDSTADPPSKRGTPVVFMPRPIPTADGPQGGNRVMSGFNPPEQSFEDFGSVDRRSFEDSAANRTTSDHRSSSLQFQVSDNIRHVEE